jgi:CrcB protein
MTLKRFFWICLGGAIGTGARYIVTGWAAVLFGPVFPWGTFAVNLTGSFLIGGIMQTALTTSLISPTVRLFLTTGVLGGLTTYSAFNYETVRYVRDGSGWLAAMNFALTSVGCFLAGMAGLVLVERIVASRAGI